MASSNISRMKVTLCMVCQEEVLRDSKDTQSRVPVLKKNKEQTGQRKPPEHPAVGEVWVSGYWSGTHRGSNSRARPDVMESTERMVTPANLLSLQERKLRTPVACPRSPSSRESDSEFGLEMLRMGHERWDVVGMLEPLGCCDVSKDEAAKTSSTFLHGT